MTEAIAPRLLAWHEQHGRKDLPWQRDTSPYRVWLSEVMLQQTQVATVIEYFNRFVARFPDVTSLAMADLDEVLHLWSGLGYYARGRNLHKAAKMIVDHHDGVFPDTVEALSALPGIGRSTAGAITAIAHQQRAAILDGNVKRVLGRYFEIEGFPGRSGIAKTYWTYAEAETPHEQVATYTQAIMDLGATVCTRSKPRCNTCPLQSTCGAHQHNTIDQFPERKPPKEKPIRAARMYVIRNDQGACLLEQRPTTGIWGGLYSPLERSADSDASAIAIELGWAPETVVISREGAPFRHTFTHFHLDITPVYCSTDNRQPIVSETDRYLWFDARTNQPVGLSAAAVKLLAEHQEE